MISGEGVTRIESRRRVATKKCGGGKQVVGAG
jgi:hypothetical protein